MAKLREERYEEKRRALKMSLKDSINFKEDAFRKEIDIENKEEKKDEVNNQINEEKPVEN